MAYQALYRKYRPTLFSEVYGQSVAKKTLQNTIKMNKISHAYLYSGPRGTGKTSIAKLFAKTINCLDIKDGNPCLNCKSCLEIASRECTDIIEIDAASNNGVDEIRELRNNVVLVPSSLKYKVYIIDEVHMLSIGAFNALLKTLEEPPEHVIFVLATTDLHKVPITIISRCQCFQFKRIADQEIVDRLKEISNMENIGIDEEVLSSIASYSDGGMRDALGMLDKLVSYSSNHITMDDMREINGLISKEEISKFIEAVKLINNVYVLKTIDYLYQNGKDMIRFVEELILNLRDQLISRYVENNRDVDELFVNQFALILNKLLSELKTSNNIKIILEIEILQYMNIRKNGEEVCLLEPQNNEQSFDYKLCGIQNKESNEISTKEIDIANRVSKKNMGENQDDSSDKPIELEKVEVFGDESIQYDNSFHDLMRKRISNTFALATKNDLLKIKESWSKLLDFSLDSEIGAVACYLTDAMVVAASSKNLILTFSYPSLVERGNSMLEKIEYTLTKIFKKYDVTILSESEWEKERKFYINQKNNKVIYEYVPEIEIEEKKIISKSNMDETDNDLVYTAIQLFGKNLVKINE